MHSPRRQPYPASLGLFAGALAVLVAVGTLGADRTSAEVWLVDAQATATSTPTSVPGEPPRVFGTVASPTATPPFRGEPPRGFAPIPTRTPTPLPMPTTPPAPPTSFEPPQTATAPDPSAAAIALPVPPAANSAPDGTTAPLPIATVQVPQIPVANQQAPATDAGMEPPGTPAADNPDQPPFIAMEPSALTPEPTPVVPLVPQPVPTVAPLPTVPPVPATPPAAPTPIAPLTATAAPQTTPTVSAASVLATLRRRLERNPTPEVSASQQCLSPSDITATNRDGSPITALQALSSAPAELSLGCANTTSGVALGWSPLSSAAGAVTYTVFRCPLQVRPETGACAPLLSAGRPELVGPLDAGYDYYVESLDARGATRLSNRLTLRR